MRTRRIEHLTFSYERFRQAAGLSKKEADSWTSRGLIRSERETRRRIYSADSVLDGIVAKRLADFSSRKLLELMMESLHEYLAKRHIKTHKISMDPSKPHIMVRIDTQRSDEMVPGYGVRGVITSASEFDPSSSEIGAGVFLVVDLTMCLLAAAHGIAEARRGAR
jgi:DNA-binding transcriptional MerR regulator